MKYLMTVLMLFALLTSCTPKEKYLDELAQMGTLQNNAAVKVDTTIMIQAPLQMIWLRVIKVEDWPGWFPKIETTVPPKEYVPGADFTWNEHGTEFSAKIATIQPGKMFSWSDRSFWASGITIWRLEYVDATHTIVTIKRSLDGALAGFLFSPEEEKKFLGDWLHQIQLSLGDIKNDKD